MTIDEAIAHANADVDTIRTALASATPEHALLVDGSAYSPSWRALDGGAAVWQATPEHDGSSYDAFDAYVDTLDRGTDELGCVWDEGCLWAPCAPFLNEED